MRIADLAPRPVEPGKPPLSRAALTRRSRRFRAFVLLALVLAWLVSVPAVVGPVAGASDPVIAAAGDIACDPASTNFNGGNGTTANCAEKATSNLLVGQGFAAVLSLGDNQYYCGSAAAFGASYDPSWGRVKSITHPVVGNHEYLTAPGTTAATGCDSSNTGAAGYFAYFGSAAGASGQGYYSYDVGAWHLIALNSNCPDAGGCGPTSPQGLWLAADLAAHTSQCLLAYWHIPLFSSGGRASPNTQQLWNQLYAAHADVVLDGHDHIYERFAPQTPTGAADPTSGIRQFTVGTGGADHTSIATIAANSEVRDVTSYGILKMTLHQGSYDWAFQPATGSFTDSGSASCHNAASGPTPTPTVTATATPTPTPTASPTSGSGGTYTFSPVADSYVDASAPTTNHGTATTIRVDGSPVVRSFLRFNVAGLGGSVTSATLRVMPTSSQSTGYTAFSVSDNTWGEATIVNANAPPFGASLGASGPATSATWTNVNVTAGVTGNGLVSFGLSTTNSTALSLSSREGTNPPQLVVTTAGSTPMPIVTPSPTPTPIVTPSPTPSPTPIVTPSPSPTPIVTPSPSPTPSPTPIVTPSPSPSPGNGTLTPVADSYVDASASTTNHGTTTTIRVDGSPVVRSYLRFNVAGLTGAATSATLRVWANSAQSTGYDVFGVADNTWVETAITDSTAPPFGTKLGSSGAVATGTWTSVNVTSAVTGNGLVSFGLSTTNSTALSLSSREGANPPQLVVTGPGLAGIVPPIPPSGSNGPGPVFAIFYLLLPVLIPGLILLDGQPDRRILGGWRAGSSQPGLMAFARAAIARRNEPSRRQVGPNAADSRP